MGDRVSISITEGVADVRLMRADKMNALDQAMFEALVAATDRLAREKGLTLQLLFAASSESMGHHDSGSDDWWRVS